MTVSSTTRKAGPFAGNGVTTSFPFTFKVFAAADIEWTMFDIYANESTLVLDSDYSISINADQDNNPGGSITYPLSGAPLPAGASLVGLDATHAKQETDLTNLGRFLPQVVENALDRLTILVQQTKEKVGRALLVTPAESGTAGTIEAAASRAGKFLGFDGGGDPIALSGTGTDAALRTDLAAAASGPALIGFNGAVNYTLGTFGAAVRDVAVNVRLFPWLAKGDGGTDDAAAINACLAANPGREILFPYTGSKYLFGSTLTIATPGTSLVGLGAANRQTKNGVELSYSGSGDAIRIGSDDGNAYNSGTFDGPQSVSIRNLAIRTATQDASLTLGFGSYKAGSCAIRNYRGSYMQLENVWIENFENGVWHIQQNNSQYQNVTVNYCKVGLYLLQSYGLCTVNWNSLYCDTAVIADSGCLLTTFINPTFTHCGTGTTPTIELRKGSNGTTLIAPYFEKQAGYNGITAPGFVRVGSQPGYSGKSAGVHQYAGVSPVYGTTIRTPYVLTTATATAYHVPYLVEFDYANFAQIDCLSGHPTYDGNLNYFINATANTASVQANAPTANRAKISTGTDTGVTWLGYGSGAIELGSNQGLVNFRNNKGAAGSDAWQWNMAVAGSIILDQASYATGQTRRLRLNRSLQSQAAMPAAGTWEIGDIAVNQAATEQGVAGSKYLILGWYRLTTGSAHVLNTDWLQMRVLTGN